MLSNLPFHINSCHFLTLIITEVRPNTNPNPPAWKMIILFPAVFREQLRCSLLSIRFDYFSQVFTAKYAADLAVHNRYKTLHFQCLQIATSIMVETTLLPSASLSSRSYV